MLTALVEADLSAHGVTQNSPVGLGNTVVNNGSNRAGDDDALGVRAAVRFDLFR